ncbi:MAG: UPF0158 family protein [Simkania sp.]|nr:UPF0158 family protein [Simkania sp.]
MKSNLPVAQNPLLLRFHRLMDAFAKSDDERDFYLDRVEGFILYVDLDKPMQEVEELEKELAENIARYALIPKMTFYETKKFMEGFVNEKVYDIDTKEKLLDIIGAKEARENFLEFIYDHLPEQEKWQQYYSERSRIRIIEWLRSQQFQFVFEEDLDLPRGILEKVKRHLFDTKVPKEVAQSRETLLAKSKIYYSNEALNPRPKRGRPPKQIVKVELEPQFTLDIYTTVPPSARPFLYLPDITASSVTFSAKFDNEQKFRASLRGETRGVKVNTTLEALSQRLESLRHLSQRLGSIHESSGSDRDDRLIKALSTTKVDIEEKRPDDEGRIASLAHGFLPKKEGERSQISAQGSPPAAMKKVTPLSTKPKKKG